MDLDALADRLAGHERPLLVTHRQADRDCLGSAFGLAAALDGDATVCAPDGVKRGARPLLADRTTVAEPTLAAHDAVVVLDAPSLDRIAPVDPTEADAPLYLLDHHARDDLDNLAAVAAVDTDAESTAELVARLIDAGGWELPPPGAVALLAGVLSDTALLASAGPEQVARVADLFDAARGAERRLAALYPPPEPDGEGAARLKGVLRAEGYAAGDTTLAVTRVGGNEGAAARGLLDAGADCAVVASDQSDHVRVVARCTDDFAERLSLGGELLPALSTGGGGHDTAGTAEMSVASVSEAHAQVVAAVERRLGVTFGEVD